MKSRKPPQLPIIDYNESEFAAHSLDALKKYGAFVLQNAPKISTEASMLLSEFDEFSYQPEHVINLFRAGDGIYDLAGFHAYEQHWAGRRFSGCYGLVSDGEGKISQPLPTESFSHAAKNFLGTAREITDKVLAAIGDGFNINSEWMNYFNGYTILGIADSYVPPTQEKIKALHSSHKLIMTDNRLEAFDPHCDINPLTLIAYRENDCTGLEMQLPDECGNLSYEPIVLPEVEPGQLTPLVLVGSPIETMTGGQLRAPKHRVVLEPMQSGEKFSRSLASAFTLFGSNSKEPQPLVHSETCSYPRELKQKDFSPEEYIKIKYDQIENECKEKVRDFPVGFLAYFPREEQIKKIKLPGESTRYIRR